MKKPYRTRKNDGCLSAVAAYSADLSIVALAKMEAAAKAESAKAEGIREDGRRILDTRYWMLISITFFSSQGLLLHAQGSHELHRTSPPA